MDKMPDSMIPENLDKVAGLLAMANRADVGGLKRLGIPEVIRAVQELRSEKKYPEIHWPVQKNSLTEYLHDAIYMATVEFVNASPIETHPWAVPLVRFFKALGFNAGEIASSIASMKLNASMMDAFGAALLDEAGDEQS